MRFNHDKKSGKITLKAFAISHICNHDDLNSEKVILNSRKVYYRRVDEAIVVSGTTVKENTYNFLPIITNSDGSPWVPVVLYIIDKVKKDFNYNPATYHSIVSDLANFKIFLDENELDLNCFPDDKLLRVTYRYRNFLIREVQLGGISYQTVKRRVSTMIVFYRFLIAEGIVRPNNPPWDEKDFYVSSFDRTGFGFKTKKKTTDLKVHINSSFDPYSKSVIDEGKLRPLEVEEQLTLVKTLIKLGNIEMLLIHLFSLFTGARMQTVLTLKKPTLLKVEVNIKEI